MNAEERKVMIALVGALAVIGALTLLGCLIAKAATLYPAFGRFMGFFGVISMAFGLWLTAWQCGRRFEAEHGARRCGCRSEDEENSATTELSRTRG